jgi:hypothetical protein
MRRLIGGLAQELEMSNRETGPSKRDAAVRTICERMRAGRTRAARVPAVTTAAPTQSTTITMIASSFVSLTEWSQWPDASSTCTPMQRTSSVAASNLPTVGRTRGILSR